MSDKGSLVHSYHHPFKTAFRTTTDGKMKYTILELRNIVLSRLSEHTGRSLEHPNPGTENKEVQPVVSRIPTQAPVSEILAESHCSRIVRLHQASIAEPEHRSMRRHHGSDIDIGLCVNITHVVADIGIFARLEIAARTYTAEKAHHWHR